MGLGDLSTDDTQRAGEAVVGIIYKKRVETVGLPYSYGCSAAKAGAALTL